MQNKKLWDEFGITGFWKWNFANDLAKNCRNYVTRDLFLLQMTQ